MLHRRSRPALPILAALIVCVACGDDGDVARLAAPPPLTTTDLLRPGAFGAGVMTLVFEDASRPTMPNGSAPGSPTRRLVTEIWYPTAPVASEPPFGQRNAPLVTDGAPYPFVVHSHGFMDARTRNGYVARHLASYGYIVAAPDFPLTNFDTPGGANYLDIVNQPGDVSFLITQLLAHEAFGPAIDTERIGLSGLSLGGTTTLLATYHPTLRDPRVRAAATLAAGACFLNQTFYRHAEVPLLLLHGDIDAIAAYRENAVFGYDQARPPKYLVTLVGASHTGFADIAAILFEGSSNPDDIGCGALGGGAGTREGVVDLLGGEQAGVFAGDCPDACQDPLPLPFSMRPSRQHQLTTLSVLAFMEASLRERTDMREFLERRLAAENDDARVEFDP